MEKEKREKLVKEFTNTINKLSVENESDTPDFILAEYLVCCLENFNNSVNSRNKWYGKDTKKIIGDLIPASGIKHNPMEKLGEGNHG